MCSWNRSGNDPAGPAPSWSSAHRNQSSGGRDGCDGRWHHSRWGHTHSYISGSCDMSCYLSVCDVNSSSCMSVSVFHHLFPVVLNSREGDALIQTHGLSLAWRHTHVYQSSNNLPWHPTNTITRTHRTTHGWTDRFLRSRSVCLLMYMCSVFSSDVFLCLCVTFVWSYWFNSVKEMEKQYQYVKNESRKW